MRVFISAPIRGVRAEKPDAYRAMAAAVQKTGHEIVTDHVGADDPEAGEVGMADRAIFERDFEWLTLSDLILAEVSTPSLGVGWELSWMIAKGRLAIVCCSKDAYPRLSAMIKGNPSPWQQTVVYEDLADLDAQLTKLLS